MARFLADLLYRPRRSLVLPLLAIALGVGAAGFGMFRQTPRVLTGVPPGYIAMVNQKGILLSDFISEVKTVVDKPFEEATPEERTQVLYQMIDEEVLVQRALVLDLPETTTEVRDAMAMGVSAQTDAALAAQPPTEDELRAFYEANRANYTVSGPITLHDLVLHVGGYENADQSNAQAQADAAEAVYQLRAGASLDHVMQHFGLVDSGRVGVGEQSSAEAKRQLGEKLYAVAAALGDGDVSDPVSDSDGVHIIVVERHNVAVVADFTAVRNQVFESYRAQQSERAKKENLAQLRSQARILIAPGFLK